MKENKENKENKEIKENNVPVQLTEIFMECYEEPTLEQLLLIGVKEYALILHDKDVKADTGELKKPHWHIYAKLRGRKTPQAIGKVFGISKEQSPHMVLKSKGAVQSIRYLVHADHLERYQYDKKEIKTNMNLDFCFDLEMTDLEFVKQIISDIDNCIITKFKDIISYAISCNKLDLVMKRAYFFKMLF